MLARAYVADAVVRRRHPDARSRTAHVGRRRRGRSRRRCRSSRSTARPSSSTRSASSARSTAPARRTSPTTSSSSPTRSAASPTTRSGPSPSTSTARTATFPRRSSPASPSSAGSASRCPRSTAAGRPAASRTTSAWSSRPKSCRVARSASAGRSSRARRSSTRALVAGGTEEQKQQWLPRIATGELMAGIMVTEPDYGSDVAGVKVDRRTRSTAAGSVNGVKTWATFAGRADVLMLLARTDADRTKGHRGLSVLIVEKPRAEGHAFQFEDGRGGKMEGRAIDTIGYRGHALVRGRVRRLVRPRRRTSSAATAASASGFYLQMAGFENGRLADRGARRRPDAGRVRSRACRTRRNARCSASRCSTTSCRG